jgi:hypothetical protein
LERTFWQIFYCRHIHANLYIINRIIDSFVFRWRKKKPEYDLTKIDFLFNSNFVDDLYIDRERNNIISCYSAFSTGNDFVYFSETCFVIQRISHIGSNKRLKKKVHACWNKWLTKPTITWKVFKDHQCYIIHYSISYDDKI